MSLWMLFLKGFYFGKNPPLEQAFNSADPAHVIWPLPHNTVPLGHVNSHHSVMFKMTDNTAMHWGEKS